MKRIGLLGGMSWESSLEYYRILNETVKEKLGESHSANCLMYSFDFHEVERLQHEGRWKELADLMVKEAVNLKAAGAQCIVICTNTMHLMAPDIERATGLKVVHIADAAGEEIKRRGARKVLLLGTKFTMEGDFYRERLEQKGIEVVIPDEKDRQIVHDIIYKELILGQINEESRIEYARIIEKAAKRGVEGVVLGCTEIPLLINQKDVEIEVFDTTLIHSKAAVDYSITSA